MPKDSNLLLKRSVALIAPIQNVSSTRVNFTDVQLLRNKKWTGLMAYSIDEVSTANQQGVANVPLTAFESAYITLQNTKGDQIIQQMPITQFNTERNGGILRELDLEDIDVPSSYIEVFNLAGLATTQAFVFSVQWEFPVKQ